MRAHVVRRPLLLGVAAALALTIVGCSSTSEQVSDEISSQVAEKLDLSSDPTVTCPDGAKAGSGETFTCTIALEKATIPVEVTFEDDTNFTSTVKGAVFKKAKLDAALKKKLTDGNVAVTSVDCEGTKLVVIGEKGTVACTATDASGTDADISVELDDKGDPKIVGSVFQNDSLEEAITGQLADNDIAVTSIDCGDPSIKVVTEDETVECAAVDANGTSATISVDLSPTGDASISNIATS